MSNDQDQNTGQTQPREPFQTTASVPSMAEALFSATEKFYTPEGSVNAREAWRKGLKKC